MNRILPEEFHLALESEMNAVTMCLAHAIVANEARCLTFAEWVKGKSVLDIAAGSAISITTKRWPPNFSRQCAHLGAKVVALDINPQLGTDRDLFEWVAVDLVTEVMQAEMGLGKIPLLKGRKFDLVYSNNFVGINSAPDLIKQLGSLAN